VRRLAIVVHDENFIGHIGWPLSEQRPQGPFQQSASVIGADNYRNVHLDLDASITIPPERGPATIIFYKTRSLALPDGASPV
jgi:hypothetical protein